MSLNELLELKVKPWLNIEVNDLTVDGKFTASNFTVTNLHVLNNALIDNTISVTGSGSDIKDLIVDDSLLANGPITVTALGSDFKDLTVDTKLTVNGSGSQMQDLKLLGNLNVSNGGILNSGPGTTGITLPNVGSLSVTPLSYYEEYKDNAFEFQGPFIVPLNATIRLVRVGKLVTLTIDSFFAATNANVVIVSTLGLPAPFRPIEDDLNLMCSVVDNGGVTLGRIQLNHFGVFTIYADNGTAGFTSPGDAGLERSVMLSYTVLT